MLSEDLGTGYCHSHGLGWMGETVAPDDIVGQLEEVGEVEEVRLLRDSRAAAVVEVLGETGPFSWFSTQPPL